jgi:cytoskeletal protein RodZ
MVKLGQRLQTLRTQKKLTIEQVSQAIKIKPVFLTAIEKGEYHKLPSPAYAQGFVRNYATYLGLSRAEITALFKREFDEKKAYKVLPDSLVKQQEYPTQRLRIQQSLLLAGIALLLFLGYLFFQYRAAFIPPALSVTVYVNNQPVTVSSEGIFSKRLTLFPGNTTITVRAENRFGKESVVQRNIVVK